jgi:hypothetical protein
MIRIALAAAAAFALSVATPALAGGCEDCQSCPHRKVAAAGEAEKKDGEAKAVACPCGDGKECKCGDACQCPHCAAKKAEKQDDQKKS